MSYLTAQESENTLTVKLTDEGRQKLLELDEDDLPSDQALLDLWDGWGNPGGNGWKEISDAICLSDRLVFARDFDDNETPINAYALPDNHLGPAEILLKGELVLHKIKVTHI